MTPRRTVVLGAGLAGLGFARHCPHARVFEAEATPGGHARSHAFAGTWFDQGAHICHSRDVAWLELIAAGGVPLHVMTKSVVLNHKAGRWFAYPVQNHLADLPQADCSAALRGFLEAQERYKDREPANYEEWCRFQYGDFLLEQFYRLYTAKYWHVPMAVLATDWLGGRLLPSQAERIVAGAQSRQEEAQAVFNAFRYPRQGGFFALVEHLYAGVDVQLGMRAVRVDAAHRRVAFADGSEESYDRLVSTIPLPALVAMLDDAPASVREAASRLRALRQYCINLVVRRERLSTANWFYVYDPDIPVSRVSFPYSLMGQENGQTAIQAEIFLPGPSRPDEESLREQAVADMGRLLDFSAREVESAEIACQPVSYVVSDLHRAPAVAHIREWLKTQKIHTAGLFGNWFYVWSDRAFAQGRDLARDLEKME